MNDPQLHYNVRKSPYEFYDGKQANLPVIFWFGTFKRTMFKCEHLSNCIRGYITKKMKFSFKDFIRYDQTRTKLWIWSHLLKKSFMENFLFCAVLLTIILYK